MMAFRRSVWRGNQPSTNNQGSCAPTLLRSETKCGGRCKEGVQYTDEDVRLCNKEHEDGAKGLLCSTGCDEGTRRSRNETCVELCTGEVMKDALDF